MPTIRTSFDKAGLTRAMDGIEKQVRFASAMTMTNVAKDMQAEVRKQLPRHFTIRNDWVSKGIQITTAGTDTLKAVVRVRDEFMALQETGGIKKSITGRSPAVPVGARPTPRSITGPDKFPRALLAKPGYFIGPLKAKSVTARSQAAKNVRRRMYNKSVESSDVGKMALWHRRGRKSLPIDLIYVFEDKVPIPPRFRFAETALATAIKQGPRRFAEAIRIAFATAK